MAATVKETEKAGETLGKMLVRAAREGNRQGIATLIEKGARLDCADIDPDASAPCLNTALETAVQKGHAQIVRQLLDAGASTQNNDHQSPLYTAIKNNHTKIVQLLITAEADVNIETGNGSLLHEAVEVNNKKIARLLIAAGINKNHIRPQDGLTAETLALTKNHRSMARLIAKTAPTEIHPAIPRKDKLGKKLAKAAFWDPDNTQRLHRLVKAGARLDAQYVSGTALHNVACFSNNAAAIAMLITAGTDVNACAVPGKSTSLHLAAQNNKEKSVNTLLQAGANVNARNSKGETPLHMAAEKGHANVVLALIKAGADINMTDYLYRSTPLHLAAGKSHTNVIKELVHAGADTTITNCHDKKASDSRNISREALEYILAAKPPAPPKTEPSPTPSPQNNAWQKQADHVIAHTEAYPALQRKITALFNFKSQERKEISTNLETGAESIAIIPFAQTPPALLNEARNAFIAAGGNPAIAVIHPPTKTVSLPKPIPSKKQG
ncbi:MAG: ankyrin repeat domain-containing protein [Alphaproteobacteria bacterium]|nr:ankyrin repeat domain-containing protein [Alphaproteobacteria bacterium]